MTVLAPCDYVVVHRLDDDGDTVCGVDRALLRAGVALDCPFCAGVANPYDLWSGPAPARIEPPAPAARVGQIPDHGSSYWAVERNCTCQRCARALAVVRKWRREHRIPEP